MLKKILAGLLVVLILVGAGGYVLMKTRGDVLLRRFGEYVEQTTGEPLLMEELPSLAFFPSPGLTLGPSSWGREDGDLFIRFARASVRVSARALLSGQLDVVSMEVDDPDVTIRLNAPQAKPSGASSEAGGSAADKPADTQALANRVLAVAPDSLRISRGRLVLKEADGTTTTLSDMDAELGNVRPGAEASLNLTARVDRVPSGRAGASAVPLAGRLTLDARAALVDSVFTASIRKAAYLPDAPGPGDATARELVLTGEGNYHLGTSSLTLTSLSLSGPGLEAGLSGTTPSTAELVRDPLRKGAASASLHLQASPRRLLDLVGRPAPFSDPSTLNRAVLDARLDLAGGTLNVTGLDGSLDAIPVGGDLAVGLAPLSVRGSLRVGDVNVDAWLPSGPADGKKTAAGTDPAAGPGKEPAKSVPAAPLWPDLDLTLMVSRLLFQGVEIAEAQARIEGGGGEYTINPLTFRAFGSPVTASASIRVPRERNAGIQTSVNASAAKIHLADLSRTLLKKDLMAGTGALNVRLACDTSNPLGTLAGRGSLSAEPLTLRIDLLPPGAPTVGGLSDLGSFQSALLTFTADKGVATITECSLTSPRLSATGRGAINLPRQTLDISGTVQVSGMAVLPVRLTGPLAHPTYSLNARTTINAVEETLKEHGVDLGTEIQRGLGRLLRRK